GGGAGDARPLQRGSDGPAARHPLRRRRHAVQAVRGGARDPARHHRGRPGHGRSRLRPAARHPRQTVRSMTAAGHDLWVFGYGSLMWRPGFAYEEAQHARLTGYRRCFCIYSVYHRGTVERPGLVLGLDRGGACEGIAYRVAGPDVAQTVGYLRAREQVNGVYRETHVPVALIEGPRREVQALTYI